MCGEEGNDNDGQLLPQDSCVGIIMVTETGSRKLYLHGWHTVLPVFPPVKFFSGLVLLNSIRD